MEPNQLSFEHDGHYYKVTRVEKSDRYSVVRDGRTVRYISNQALMVAISKKDHEQVIVRLFNDAQDEND